MMKMLVNKLIFFCNRILFALLIIILASSCSSLKRGCFQSNSYKMKNYSILQQPIMISKLAISDYVYNTMPEVIYKGGEKDGLDFNIEVKKMDVPQFSVNGKRLNIQLPLLVNVSKKMGFMNAFADGEIVLEIGSNLDIDQDWYIRTKTELEAYSWTKEPQLKLMGMNIPVTNITNKLIEDNKETLTSQMDNMIGNLPILKNAIDKMLTQFERTTPIGKNEEVALDIQPTHLSLAPFVTDMHTIGTVVQLMALVEVYTASEIQISSSSKTREKLPFTWIQGPLKEQEISLSMDLTKDQLQFVVDSIVKSLSKEERSFEIRNRKVELAGVEVLVEGEKIGAKVFLRGGYKGTVDYLAEPNWRDGKKKVVLCNAELDSDIKGGRSKMLLFFFKKSIKRKITRVIEESLNEIIRRAT